MERRTGMQTKILDKVKAWAGKILPYALVILLTALLTAYLYSVFKPAETVTTESQKQAETVEGVKKAAENANITINTGQAQEASEKIKYIYASGEAPQYTIITTGDKARETVREEQEKSKADFSIVTDKNNPDEAVDLDSIPKDTKVELNQYNINAYKKVLHTVEVSPNLTDRKIGSVGYTVSKRVTDSGRYMGVGVEHNFDSHRTYLKLSYTW